MDETPVVNEEGNVTPETEDCFGATVLLFGMHDAEMESRPNTVYVETEETDNG